MSAVYKLCQKTEKICVKVHLYHANSSYQTVLWGGLPLEKFGTAQVVIFYALYGN